MAEVIGFIRFFKNFCGLLAFCYGGLESYVALHFVSIMSNDSETL